MSTIPNADRDKIKTLQKRSASAMSNLSNRLPVDKYFDGKIESLEADLALSKQMKQSFMNAYESGDLSKTMYDDALEDAMTHEQDLHNDLHVAKKERKTVIDDMQEVSKNDLAEAFIGAVSSKSWLRRVNRRNQISHKKTFAKGSATITMQKDLWKMILVQRSSKSGVTFWDGRSQKMFAAHTSSPRVWSRTI